MLCFHVKLKYTQAHKASTLATPHRRDMFPTFADGEKIEDHIHYLPVAVNKQGGRRVAVSSKPKSNDYNDRIRFQLSEDNNTNLQTIVWNPIIPEEKQRLDIMLTIESQALIAYLDDLDALNQKTSQNLSKEWFNGAKPQYKHIVTPPDEKQPKHTMKIKVNTGTYPTQIHKVVKEEDGKLFYVNGTYKDLVRNAKCMVMAENAGIWIMNMTRQFGMSLVAKDIIVWPPKTEVKGISGFTLTLMPELVKEHPDSGEEEGHKKRENEDAHDNEDGWDKEASATNSKRACV